VDTVPAIQFQNVTKRFPGVLAVQGVSFDVHQGVCHAICGENGAGKSTLGKMLAGIHTVDEGQLRLHGQAVRLTSPADARAAGVGMVHQELAFAENLSIAENLCLGALPRRLGFVDRGQVAARARAMLEAIGADGGPGSTLDVRRPVGALTVGEQQVVQIAGAVGSGARVIVFDEPTSSLSEREVQRLFGLIDRLKQQGVTMLYVSHRMPEIYRLCEWVTVLRDGRHVVTRPAAELSEGELVRAMIGRDIEVVPSAEPAPGPTRLAVRDLGSPGKFAGVSFQLRAGEILGLAGLVGAGRTEILQALFGLDPARTGVIEIEGVAAAPRDPRAARALGLGLVPEDRKRQGLVLGLSARENLTLPLLDEARLSRAGFVRRDAEEALARQMFQQLRVRAPGTSFVVAGLSGGNQQKIVLARWLAARCRVLLLDEPTRGVDVGAKAEIHALIDALAAEGAAVLLVSSELPELLALSHRILVLREGRPVGELARAQASEEAVMNLMMGTARAERPRGPAVPPQSPPPPPDRR
jgi:ABC-type sugar transport system ATPase subunit